MVHLPDRVAVEKLRLLAQRPSSAFWNDAMRASRSGLSPSVSLIFVLRAHAPRRTAALPNFTRCMAEKNAAIPEGRSKSETSHSHCADGSGQSLQLRQRLLTR